jgi:hypothetical protein
VGYERTLWKDPQQSGCTAGQVQQSVRHIAFFAAHADPGRSTIR